MGTWPGEQTGDYGYFGSNGNKYTAGSGSAYGATFTTGDVIGVALDLDAGTLTFYKNNTSQGTAYSSISGTFFPAIGKGITATGITSFINFGQRPFSYTPPTGYVAPTILQGNKYMDATLYSGLNAPQTIVNQSQFQPDMVWFKTRNVVGNNTIYDVVRGVTKLVFPNSANAESTYSGGLTSFNTNGFSVAYSADSNFNASGYTYVAWNWQAGQGSTSSNTSGSITSTVSVNATAGFSIVTYTGAGTSAGTVGHGLGVAPKLIIAKTRTNAQDWVVYHSVLGTNQLLILNSTSAASTISNYWGSSAPTSTVFGVYTGNNIGNNNYLNIPIVAYCWAEIAGFSKFGSYTGNSSTDGPFVYLGFRPKFVIFRDYTNAHSWVMVDSSRNTYNVAGDYLRAESTAVENATYSVANNTAVDFLSNGFKLRNAAVNSGENNGSSNYIYMAFAENPFKNANAR